MGDASTVRDLPGGDSGFISHYELTAATDGDYLVSKSTRCRVGDCWAHVRFDANGVEIASSSIRTDTLNLGDGFNSPLEGAPLGDGSFITIWNRAGKQLAAVQFDNSGKVSGAPLPIGSEGEFKLALPILVTPLTGGGFAVAWGSSRFAGTEELPAEIVESNVYSTSFHPPEADLKAQKARQARLKLCKAQAKGMNAQERKRFIDSCMQN